MGFERSWFQVLVGWCEKILHSDRSDGKRLKTETGFIEHLQKTETGVFSRQPGGSMFSFMRPRHLQDEDAHHGRQLRETTEWGEANKKAIADEFQRIYSEKQSELMRCRSAIHKHGRAADLVIEEGLGVKMDLKSSMISMLENNYVRRCESQAYANVRQREASKEGAKQ
jgi:hypothetical protein